VRAERGAHATVNDVTTRLRGRFLVVGDGSSPTSPPRRRTGSASRPLSHDHHPASAAMSSVPRLFVRRRPSRGARWLLAGALLITPASLVAQTPPPSVTVAAFGVDTTATDVGRIVALLRAYLERPQAVDGEDRAARETGLWSTGTELDEREGDLTRGMVYQGFRATIVGVTSAGAGDSVYVAKVLYATADSARTRISPLALQRLFAIRSMGAPYGWQLATPLPRITQHWERRSVGPITFRYAPGQRPDPARAARATEFVADVARRFAVAPPERIDYVVAGSPDEYHRALGLDYFVLPSGPGTGTGGVVLGDELVLSGDPAQGEAYLHELAHLVLRPLGIRNHLVSEGIASWLGGSQGRSLPQLADALAAFQRDRPDVTLAMLLSDQVPDGGQAATVALYATAALLVEDVHRTGGMAAVRELTTTAAGADAALGAVRKWIAGEHASEDAWWRALAARRVGRNE